MNAKQIVVIVVHAVIGWAACGMVMGIGRSVTTLENALVIQLIAAPIFFALISWFYFTRFSYASPLTTALIFMGFVIGMDAFLVAPVFEKSYAMFTSVIGTWLPFAFIFLSTYLTGMVIQRQATGLSARSMARK